MDERRKLSGLIGETLPISQLLLVVREKEKYYARWLFGCKDLGPITQKAHQIVGELRVEAKLGRMQCELIVFSMLVF
jgi:hypothetical protein